MLKTCAVKNEDSKTLVYHNSCYAMGTRLNVVIVDPLLDSDFIFDRVVREVMRLEAKLSRFSENSDVYVINRNAGYGAVRMDVEMANILSLCSDYYRRTCGAFDITLPSQYYRQQTGTADVRKHSFDNVHPTDHLLLDTEQLTVAFTSPSIQIDLGGFGKGYAVQKIELILKNAGVQNALVSFGESSILAMGRHPYGNCWKIGIEDCGHPGCSAHIFDLKNQSLSTSGFQRSMDNAKGFHIISPLTQRPVEVTSSITVQSSDPLESEILSTALFASLGTDVTFLDNFNDYHIIQIDYHEHQLTEICSHER